MINRIRIQDLATFTQPVDICPKDINFMYGGNGTGKTTISKLISGEIGNAFSTVEGLDPATETTLVYNKTFVDATFQENKEIPGIFTLGLEAGEAQEYVRLMEEKCVAFSDEIKAKEGTIKNLLQEKEKSQAAFTDVCWQTQVEYGKMFPKAMIGTRAAKDAFRDKCLDAYNELHSKDDTSNGSHVHSQDELKILYDRVFAEDAVTLDEYPLLDAVEATQVDTLDILSKPITGKADSDIGRFIDYLGSSDWAKHGEELSKRSEGKCPYCARILPVNIRKDIEAYFDDTYKNELGELRTYIDSYARISQSTINRLDTILANPYANFQYDEIAAKAELYKARVEKNLGLLGKKAETPSVSVELTACADLVTHINDLLEILNNEIAENNNRVADIKTAKAECQTAVWCFFAKALSESARVYLKQSSGNAKAIEKVTAKRNNLEEQRTLTNGQIVEKRLAFTNVESTTEAINKVLDSYGFTGFKLAVNSDIKGTYRILRPDGTDAKLTLSEGERNFLAFLYFYHMIFGSKNPEDISKSRIIIIDDPISSLDSNVLFIVSSLVKNILLLCRDNKQSIIQVLISTHNIYFHKEITFLSSREAWPSKRTNYYIIRKNNEKSSIDFYNENQIKSSYELLWDDVKEPSKGTAMSAFNAMRRILENYFNVIGGLDYEKCIEKFDGADRCICKSLVSCINEQSHTIPDDYYMCIQDNEIEQYRRVFKEIFSKMKHISHYNMMMKIVECEDSEVTEAVTGMPLRA